MNHHDGVSKFVKMIVLQFLKVVFCCLHVDDWYNEFKWGDPKRNYSSLYETIVVYQHSLKLIVGLAVNRVFQFIQNQNWRKI
ncbi:MAG: hypothetical protein CL609_08970 [Anaerolineaceae bacterium]|nr:hypothetical protein [Anaerolineaceae bacterium]